MCPVGQVVWIFPVSIRSVFIEPCVRGRLVGTNGCEPAANPSSLFNNLTLLDSIEYDRFTHVSATSGSTVFDGLKLLYIFLGVSDVLYLYR